jgi:hypothetical protein
MRGPAVVISGRWACVGAAFARAPRVASRRAPVLLSAVAMDFASLLGRARLLVLVLPIFGVASSAEVACGGRTADDVSTSPQEQNGRYGYGGGYGYGGHRYGGYGYGYGGYAGYGGYGYGGYGAYGAYGGYGGYGGYGYGAYGGYGGYAGYGGYGYGGYGYGGYGYGYGGYGHGGYGYGGAYGYGP